MEKFVVLTKNNEVKAYNRIKDIDDYIALGDTDICKRLFYTMKNHYKKIGKKGLTMKQICGIVERAIEGTSWECEDYKVKVMMM